MLFDPKQISYEALLAEFWKQHDPRHGTSNRQYRAAVFTRSDAQARIATASRDALGSNIATAIEPLTNFTPAEDYHQKYYFRQSRDLVRTLSALTGNERAFMDTTAAARLNAYFGDAATAADVERELVALGLDAPTVSALMPRIRRAAGDR